MRRLARVENVFFRGAIGFQPPGWEGCNKGGISSVKQQPFQCYYYQRVAYALPVGKFKPINLTT